MMGSGGVTGSGGSLSTGGTAGSPAPTCSPACVAPTGGTNTCVSGTCMATCTTSGQSVCSNACVDTNTDKNNCGACGTTCEGYQYCSAGKCVPHYEWTRVMPVNPLDAIGTIQDAKVSSNGDIVVEIDLSPGSTSASITLSNAQETNTQISTANSTVLIARYSETGPLQYQSSGNLAFAFMNQQGGIPNTSVSGIALTTSGDVVVSGLDTITSATGGPSTASQVVVQLDSTASLNRKWSATYSGDRIAAIFPRATRSDYITAGYPPDEVHGINGDVGRIPNTASAGTVLAPYIANTAALGVDGTTLWLAGGNYGETGLSGPNQLNPWITSPSSIVSGQSFIVGAKDDGTSIGPWFTTNAGTRPASLWRVLPDGSNTLIVLAGGGGRGDSGAVTLNGTEILGASYNAALFKMDTTTGSVAWKTDLTSGTLPSLTLAPDGTVVAVSPLTATYGMVTYSDANGATAASFTGSGQAQAVVSGGNSLFIAGIVTGSADFNPGAGTDIEGNLPGVFISRFSY